MLQCSTLIGVDHGLDNRATIDMNELNNAQKNELRNIIDAGYNLSEMKLLCGNLGVDWEDVSAETTRQMFAQELVHYFERQLEILEETDTTASIEVFLTLTKYDNTVVNQPVVYRLTRPTGAEPWIIADSSP